MAQEIVKIFLIIISHQDNLELNLNYLLIILIKLKTLSFFSHIIIQVSLLKN